MEREQAVQIIESLFGSWEPSLTRFVLRRTHSREMAEDLVQEAFLALYRALRKGERIENLKGWTMTVVQHHLAKRFRGHERFESALEAAQEEGLLSVPPYDSTTGHDLHTLMKDLSPREEEVLLLRMESLRYHEIAAQLGISAKSVGTMLARALQKLKSAAAATGDAAPSDSRSKRHAFTPLQ